jgi:signal transduction histidine kinase
MTAEETSTQALARQEILSRLSHELRTPLNAVIGFSRVLTNNRAGSQGAREQAMLESIRANGERLLDLVEDLFDVAASSPEQPATLVPVNVVAAARSAVNASLGAAAAKGLDLELVVKVPEQAVVLLDAARLLRILRKIIGNAVKFTPDGSVTVTVEGDADSGRPTAIRVRDTGIGVPAALQASIFDPFVQADIGTRRAYEGAGLGLSVARTLAESMGCRLRLESEPGIGSQFVLLFPP